jgi:hypothetical protein
MAIILKPMLIFLQQAILPEIFLYYWIKENFNRAKTICPWCEIEHPQNIIDSIQYHCAVRSRFLPPASYSLVEQVNGKGVFSFCMCPGGIIAPAATDNRNWWLMAGARVGEITLLPTAA